MEGAEFIQAVAPGVTVADINEPLYSPRVVQSFFPFLGLHGVDAAAGAHPLLAAQVTELADGVFVAMSLNHAIADGAAFWHLFNTWAEFRRESDDAISSPLPVHRRWFADGFAVPVPLPFGKLEDIHVSTRTDGHPSSVHEECILHFSAESVKKLKAKANAEMSGNGSGTTTNSSLQALLAHLWIAASRARRLAPDQKDIVHPPSSDAGANWMAYRLPTRATRWHSSRRCPPSPEYQGQDAGVLKIHVLESWPKNPRFACMSSHPTATDTVVTGGSPRFDVYGNDFGWGQPVAVRTGPANKAEGSANVYEGRGGRGSITLEVCLAPDVLARLVADEEFMSAASA
uniref:Putative acetyltransferase n=1 Tax=Aegilops tauschii TaxID=37682 RepID=M8BIA9_AEGTA